MRNLTRIIVFGTCSGLVWSLAPGLYGGLFFYSHVPLVLFFVSFALICILVSFLLAIPLIKANHWVITLLLGVLALPIGAFCFGLFFSLFQNSGDSAFKIGLDFAFWSTVGPYVAIILVPSALLTTFVFWK